MTRRSLPIFAAFLLVIAAPSLAQNPHQTLLAKADALVTVKFVLKVKMEGSADNEFDGEITCQLIDPEGLVLCSNTELGGYVTLMSRVMGRGSGFNVSAAPTDIEVVLPDRAEGVKGRLLTRDSDRDLAWIRLEEPPAGAGAEADKNPLPYLDFRRSAEPEVGEKYSHLRRLHKFFGHAPTVSEGTVGAVIRKPRRLLVPSRPSTPGFGVPAFTADGRLVGVTVLQLPGAEDDAARLFGNPMSMLGTSVSVQDMIGGLILPASEVVKATELAREVFSADEEEEGDGRP